MNKRLSKTGIEYLTHAWNFMSGCTNGCPYCWARPITNRFKDRYPNGFEPTVYPEALLSPLYLKKPSIIGCAFMGDLFDDAIDPNMPTSVTFPNGQRITNCHLSSVLRDIIQKCPQHRFLVLTKQPQNLLNWSPFPENCWVGVTVTTIEQLRPAIWELADIQASLRYISFEPLLESVISQVLPAEWDDCINWLIIGAQTRPYRPPQIEWVQEIVEAADRAGIPVFLKDNLLELVNYESPETAFAFNKEGYYRQELP